jgi:hypothetical protein
MWAEGAGTNRRDGAEKLIVIFIKRKRKRSEYEDSK